MKKNNKKGFTLAELLIVVAIIAVLVAVAIPVFTTQLEKSKEATDLANLRTAYAEAVADALGTNSDGTSTFECKQGSAGFTHVSTDDLPKAIKDGANFATVIAAMESGKSVTVTVTPLGAVTLSIS